MNNFILIIGIIASICIAAYNIPMFVSVFFINKNTKAVNLPMYIIMVTGMILFLIQGLTMICTGNISGGVGIFAANLVSTIIAVPILIFKIKNYESEKVAKTK